MTSLSPAQVAGTACIRCGELLDNTAVPVGRFRGHRDSCTPKPAPWVHTAAAARRSSPCRPSQIR